MALLSSFINCLASIFFAIGLGYICKASEFIPFEANKGIGPLVGKVCLPMLIFRNVAKLDFFATDMPLLGTIVVVKLCSFCMAAIVAYFT